MLRMSKERKGKGRERKERSQLVREVRRIRYVGDTVILAVGRS